MSRIKKTPRLFVLISSSFFLAIVAALAGINVVLAGTAASPAGNSPSAYHLPEYIHPLKYELWLEPDLQKATFAGKALIKIAVTKKCRQIFLNACDLKVLDAGIVNGIKPEKSMVSYRANQERIILDFPEEISAGTHQLSLTFRGVLNDKLVGFYRSKFVDTAGKLHYLAVTQMEPTDARRMFPCFDEPQLKASFKINVVIDPVFKAISNGPIESEKIDAVRKKKTVSFAETPKMSTYLVALLIGEFQATEPLVVEGIPIRVWSVAHEPSLGNYARDMAGKILPYLNSYFRIPYPWKKLDLIAIPDFEAGAMENPGAITFRESRLLADENKTSLDARQDCVSVIAHEMAHMWFGDLVTMQWWDDLWLNEAFATWMSVKAVDHVSPEWEFLSRFCSERQIALRTDSMRSSRSIHANVNKPSDAMQMFDEITYSKGASILRMLEMFLGEPVFQNGIHNYLREHAYGNARTEELWLALSTVSGQPVSKIMNGWANQAGYPLLVLQNAETSGITASQERFVIDGTAGEGLWKIPLRIKIEEEQTAKTSEAVKLFDRKNGIVSLPGGNGVLNANAGGWGFYRVLYPSSLWQFILPRLQTKLNGAERQGLLSDQFALVVANKIKVGEYLNILSAFRPEQDLSVWETLLRQLRYMDLFIESSRRQQYESFVRFLLSDIYADLGWEAKKEERATAKIIRGQVIEILGTLAQDPKVIAEARRKFALYIQKPDAVNPDLLDAVTSIVAYNGDQRDFESIRQIWKKARDPEVEQRNLMALSRFRNPVLIKRCLDMSISAEVRSQDQPHLLRSLLHSSAGRFLAWDFMRRNWPLLKKLYSTQMIAGLSGAPDWFTRDDKYKEIKSFFVDHKVVAGESDIARMLERLKTNIRFADRSGAALNAWLAAWKRKDV